jgi:voltage-gated potassium channel Kch
MSLRTRGGEDYGTVLLLIVGVLALAPFESSALRPLIVFLLGLTFVLAVWTSGSSLGLLTLSAVLATAGVIVAGATQFTAGNGPRLSYGFITAFLCAATITAIIRRLSSQLRISRRTVTGAPSVYLLIGLLFANLDSAIGLAQSTGFFAQPGRHNAVAYLYFSYITLTTTGYGDLTPSTDSARMLAVIEALLGQLYLVTIVALVVSNLGRERLRPPTNQQH